MSRSARVLVSACLLGVPCRYDGRSVACGRVCDEAVRRGWIPVCPEILGGLPTPRCPAERREGRVITREGGDVTEAYARGAEQALSLARLYGVRAALLKERSPSCGRGRIYDGTFTGTLIAGSGVTAERLAQAGIPVFGESELDDLLEALDK